MWVYNSLHGSRSVKGWLYEHGDWRWGCCITWHVVDLNPDESHIQEGNDDESCYYWYAHLWRWSCPGVWYHAPFLSIPAEHAFVEKWMVHEEDVREDWLTRFMSGPMFD